MKYSYLYDHLLLFIEIKEVNMLKNSEIIKKFGIASKTLYNWSESRPELYEFLKKSDDYFDKARDLNLLLRAYKKTIIPTFTKSELQFLVELDYKEKPTNLFEEFPEKFLQLCSKKLSTDNKIIIEILPKITTLSHIEKYLLLDKIYTYQSKLKDSKKDIDIKEYFLHLFGIFIKK